MTLKTNSAEGGTNTTVATQAVGGNTGGGSGDFFDVLAANTQITFDNSQSMHGSLSYKIVNTNSTPCYVSWTGYADTTIAYRFYIRFATLPTVAGFRVTDPRDTAGAGVGRLFLNATNKFSLQNAAGTAVYTATNAISANTWYRVEVVAGTGTAVYKFDYYLGDSLTPVETGFSNAAQTNGSSNNIANIRIGNAAAVTYAGTMFIDDVAANNGSTSYIGPASTAWTQAPADAEGLTDAVTVAAAYAAAASDSEGLTDAVTVAAAYGVAQADALGLTDAVTVVSAKTVTSTDSEALADAVTVAMSYAVAQTDALGLTDTATTVVVKTVSIADSLAITDTDDTEALSIASTIAESAGLTDAVAAVVDRPRAVADTADLSDSIAFELVRSLSDTMGLPDTLELAAAFERIVAEQVGLSDTTADELLVQLFQDTTITIGPTRTNASVAATRDGGTVVDTGATRSSTSVGDTRADTLTIADTRIERRDS